MRVCVYACMRIHMYACMRICVYACARVCVRVCVRARVHVLVRIRVIARGYHPETSVTIVKHCPNKVVVGWEPKWSNDFHKISS